MSAHSTRLPSIQGSAKSRMNKIYRTPSTPPPDDLRKKEKTFVLDCQAASSISCDYSRANPKLGPVIPPYNSQRDRHVDHYFSFHGVPRTLDKTGQSMPTSRKSSAASTAKGSRWRVAGGTSIEGPVMDAFHTRGAGYQYLSLRNKAGAGHSQNHVNGHAQFMEDIKPVSGYNGRYGFRRNTPWLRKQPSPFYPNSIAPTF